MTGRGIRAVALGLLAFAAVVPAPAASGQDGGGASAGARPTRVRVGDTFVVTVRAVGAARPDGVELDADGRSEMVHAEERESWAVGSGGALVVVETHFTLRALSAGRTSPRRAAVLRGGDTTWVEIPSVEASAAAVAFAEPAPVPRRTDPGELRAQGLPPGAVGRDGRPYPPYSTTPPYAAYPPYGWSPSDPAGPGVGGAIPLPGGPVVGLPWGGAAAPPWGAGPGAGYAWGFGDSGWGMAAPGRPWGPSAAADPWWPELIPRLERYQTTASDPDRLLSLEAGAAPPRAYVGQQVTLIATASFAPEALARLAPAPELLLPPGREAWSVDVPYAPPTPAAAGGRVHEAHTVMRAYFPVGAGSLELGSVRLRYAVGSGGAAHAPLDELATEPLSVEVLPVPLAQAPAGWGGAVGRYRVAAWIEPRAVGWGEAALLTVEVAGAGNVRALARPDPGPVWGAELRPAGERATVEVRDGVVGGAKTFTWLVVPVEPAVVRIGPVVYPYFDPWVGSFGTAASEEVSLDARGLEAVAGGFGPGGPGEAGGAWAPDGGWDAASRDDGREGPASDPHGWEAGGEGAARPPGAPDETAPDADPAVAAAWLPPAAARVGHGEPRVRAALALVAEERGDAGRWLALGEAFAAERPGEGWREWALLSGAARAPRDPRLRAALWEHGGWAGPAWGLQRLPLAPAESRLAAVLATAMALGLLGVGARLPGGSRGRRGLSALAAAALAAGGVVAEPWVHHAADPAVGVVVEGPAEIRSSPSWSAPVAGSAPAGAPLELGEGFGAWVGVTGGAGARGWVEASQVVPLDPPLGG